METIKEQNAIELYENDLVRYSVIVNRRRALPAIKDGLIPVKRRILFAAFKHGLTSPKKTEKSATLVGYIIGNLHPHGDASAYGTIVNLAQWFSTKYILMYPDGGYGSVDGSSAASMRYTHAGLSEFGYDALIQELHESDNVVNWVDTFLRDGSKEPEYLPAKLPILLINGAFGIGLGMQIKLPPHNLSEVVAATRQLLKNPNSEVVLIPDFCQACDIIDTDWKAISNNGGGAIKVRGRIVEEQDKKGNVILRIASLPDGVYTSSVYEKIIELIDKKELPMIKSINDGLDAQERPDIIIALRPGADVEYVKHVIYAKTNVQMTYAISFEAVDDDDINLKRFSYKEYLLKFLKFRMSTKFRLYCNKLQQVMTRHHYIDAFIKVLESGELETIIAMVRKQKTVDEAPIIEYIIKHCGTTDIQAKFIINTNIGKLTLAHLNKYKAERADLEGLIKEYMPKVTDDGSLIRKEIDQELADLEKKYRTPRLCRVVSGSDQDNIPGGIFKVIVTERNFLRKIPDSDRIGAVKRDNPKLVIRIDNRSKLLVFDSKGKAYILPVHKIPLTDKTGPGVDVRILIKNLTANIINIFDEALFKQISECPSKHYLVVATRNNLIKKLDIEDFLNITPSGLIYTKLAPNDEVVGLLPVQHNLDLVIGSYHKAIRVNMKDIPLLKRGAMGNRIMDTDEPIGGMSVIYPNVTNIMVVTKAGKVNRFAAEMLQAHKRGIKGNIIIKLDPNDEIVAVLGCNENDVLSIITDQQAYSIPVCNIKIKSPIAPGTKVIGNNQFVLKTDILKGM